MRIHAKVHEIYFMVCMWHCCHLSTIVAYWMFLQFFGSVVGVNKTCLVVLGSFEGRSFAIRYLLDLLRLVLWWVVTCTSYKIPINPL